MDIDGAVAAVTGGAGGLGLATAERLAGRGAQVAILDLNPETGEAAAIRLGPTSVYVPCDVRDPGSVARSVSAVVERFGRIDLLVNAAGVASAQRVVGRDGTLFDLELFKSTVDVNLIGTFDVIRNVAGRMAEKSPGPHGERGVIVNVASIAAFDGQIGQVAYSASKGGVVGMTLPLARDLSAYGIRVVTVAPGLFATPMLGQLPQEAISRLESQVLFPKRLGDPDEFAQLVESLVENPYINGETIRLDAGTRMPSR